MELVFIWIYLRYILYQGHKILNIKLNGWIFLCILQEISILFCLNPFVIKIVDIFLWMVNFLQGSQIIFAAIMHIVLHSSKEVSHNAVVRAIPFT